MRRMDFVLLGCHCVLASCHDSSYASWMSVFIYVSGQQHTLKPWAGLVYTTSNFPVVISAMLFPSHIELILASGGANAPSFVQLFLQHLSSLGHPSRQVLASQVLLSVQSCCLWACGVCALHILFQVIVYCCLVSYLKSFCGPLHPDSNEDLPEMISPSSIVDKNLNLGVLVLRTLGWHHLCLPT